MVGQPVGDQRDPQERCQHPAARRVRRGDRGRVVDRRFRTRRRATRRRSDDQRAPSPTTTASTTRRWRSTTRSRPGAGKRFLSWSRRTTTTPTARRSRWSRSGPPPTAPSTSRMPRPSSYQPEPGYVGLDRFDYTIVDGNGTEASAVVILELLPVDAPNQAPVARDDVAETGPDVGVVIDVLLNDVDPERDALAGGVVHAARHRRHRSPRPSVRPGCPPCATNRRSGRPAGRRSRTVPSTRSRRPANPPTVRVEIAQPQDDNRPPIVQPDAVRLRRNTPTSVAGARQRPRPRRRSVAALGDDPVAGRDRGRGRRRHAACHRPGRRARARAVHVLRRRPARQHRPGHGPGRHRRRHRAEPSPARHRRHRDRRRGHAAGDRRAVQRQRPRRRSLAGRRASPNPPTVPARRRSRATTCSSHRRRSPTTTNRGWSGSPTR